MFLIAMLFLILLLFSGGGYYGHRRGYYGRGTAYGGIGLERLVILLLVIFLMPQWGYMHH